MLKAGDGVLNMDDKILCLLKDNYFSIENDFESNNGDEISEVLTCSSKIEYVF